MGKPTDQVWPVHGRRSCVTKLETQLTARIPGSDSRYKFTGSAPKPEKQAYSGPNLKANVRRDARRATSSSHFVLF